MMDLYSSHFLDKARCAYVRKYLSLSIILTTNINIFFVKNTVDKENQPLNPINELKGAYCQESIHLDRVYLKEGD